MGEGKGANDRWWLDRDNRSTLGIGPGFGQPERAMTFVDEPQRRVPARSAPGLKVYLASLPPGIAQARVEARIYWATRAARRRKANGRLGDGGHPPAGSAGRAA
eukprot:1464173-Alexandrium_andersonii.AAC.1